MYTSRVQKIVELYCDAVITGAVFSKLVAAQLSAWPIWDTNTHINNKRNIENILFWCSIILNLSKSMLFYSRFFCSCLARKPWIISLNFFTVQWRCVGQSLLISCFQINWKIDYLFQLEYIKAVFQSSSSKAVFLTLKVFGATSFPPNHSGLDREKKTIAMKSI